MWLVMKAPHKKRRDPEALEYMGLGVLVVDTVLLMLNNYCGTRDLS